MLDICSGRWGWSQAFAAREWDCVGVDIVEPPFIPNGCTFKKMDAFLLTVEDVRQFDFGCASTPCEEFSVFGMRHFHPNPKYPAQGIQMFNHVRELFEKSGIPYIMENVRPAQQFVGRATHHCGSFYLWGTGVPPLMPQGITKGTHDIKGVAVNQSKRFFRGAGERWQQASQVWSGSKAQAEYTAELATIPPELANCVADYAERICPKLDSKVAS